MQAFASTWVNLLLVISAHVKGEKKVRTDNVQYKFQTVTAINQTRKKQLI